MKPSHERFVAVLLADPQMAAIPAYMKVYGCERSTAESHAWEVFNRPDVQQAIEKGKAERLKRLELTADDVLRDIALGVGADGNELAEHVIDCCRYCHGEGHKYQFTPAEFQRAIEQYLAADAVRKGGPKDPLGLLFNPKGGVGFDPRKPPADDCPECFGRGEPRIVAKDTRYLSEKGRRQYSGVKLTKHGPELQMRSRDKALELAAKHTGVAKEHIKLETVRDMSDEELARETARLEHKVKGGKP